MISIVRKSLSTCIPEVTANCKNVLVLKHERLNGGIEPPIAGIPAAHANAQRPIWEHSERDI